MIAVPAVDLRDGRCVQLVGGDFAQEKVRLDDPAQVARDWVAKGFNRLHVVDLDAATGRGSNIRIIREILGTAEVPVQVGGGVRDEDQIEQLIESGATWVVVGTRAIEDTTWRDEVAARFPGRLIVAADVRERLVVTRGWSRTSRIDVISLMEELSDLPLAGVLVTAVHQEGQLQGTDLFLMEDVAEANVWPTLASGGITTIEDLRALEHRGVAGAVLGMTLYTGAIDESRVAGEFAA